MKTYIIGDIHGAGNELMGLMDVISPGIDDRIISVGDIFDRGNAAPKVWEILKGREVFMGNHEYKLNHWLSGRRDWLTVAFYYALNLLYENGLKPSEMLEWSSCLPWIKDYGNFVITHSGVVLDDIMKCSTDMNIFYSTGRNVWADGKHTDKDKNWWDLYDGEKLIVYGHLVTGDNLPRVRRNKQGKVNSIGLDTAACHGGNLTAYCPEEDKFYSYSSGIDWGEQVLKLCKEKPPIIAPEIMAFVREQREIRLAERVKSQTATV